MNRHDGPEDGSLLGSLSARRTARVRHGVRRELPSHRADGGRHLDLLRRRPGPGISAQHRHEREPAPAGTRPPVVWRLARPLGRRDARDRRDELQPARATSWARARTCISSSAGRGRGRTRSSTPSRSTTRRCGRRPWTVKEEFTKQNEQGEPDLLRAALPRRELRLPDDAPGGASGGEGVCREARAPSGDEGQRHRFRGSSRRIRSDADAGCPDTQSARRPSCASG